MHQILEMKSKAFVCSSA